MRLGVILTRAVRAKHVTAPRRRGTALGASGGLLGTSGRRSHGLWTVEECIEDLFRNADARVLLVPSTEGTEVGIRLRRRRRQLIEPSDLVGVERRARGRLGSPYVPRQHLHLVERRGVADQASRDEPEAIKVDERDPERGGIALAATAAVPGDGRRQELISGHVERIERDVQPIPADVGGLAVGQEPAMGFMVPILTDPVIFELRWIEVRAESASRPRRNPLGPEHRDEEKGELVTPADHALVLGWAGGGA